MRAAISIKSWIARTPSVEQVRPPQCAGCGVASRPVGKPIQVHGQGLLVRQVRGVLEADGEPGVWEVAVRRYECQRCGAVMTVVPAEMLARRQYSAPSIALALYLWVMAGLPDRKVRERVCAWAVATAEAGHSYTAGLATWVACFRCRVRCASPRAMRASWCSRC